MSLTIEKCHVCQAEAVGRCYECGRLYCAAHDVQGNCSVCATAIHEYTGDKVSTRALPGRTRKAWWRPQVDEDDPGPPSCYQCGGLANRVCRNCNNLFCAEHGAAADLCASCARSSWVAMWIIIGVLAILAATVLLTTLIG
jgi:hypothetical protein